MRVRESVTKKNQSNLTNVYGSFYSRVFESYDEEKAKRIANVQNLKNKAAKIKNLIALFRKTFETCPEVVESLESLFKIWESQKFYKDIPQAMIQMKNCFDANKFQKEWEIWKKTVSDELPNL